MTDDDLKRKLMTEALGHIQAAMRATSDIEDGSTHDVDAHLTSAMDEAEDWLRRHSETKETT